MSDADWTIDTPTEVLWDAVDELRQRRQGLVSTRRLEKSSFNQRVTTFQSQMSSNPAMRANAETQMRMMVQQKNFAKENFLRQTDEIDGKIVVIERLLDKQRARDIAKLKAADASQLQESCNRLSLQWGELRSEVNIFKSEFARQLDELRQVVATLKK
ncbi:Aste57867_240 [Aphanomyces stellatus]|uniref:Aste57867_240 protein n=1 Tax=Aphanomyces stellatus TaxID=120398 RepID=A0A485K4M1_9STRA|nr:hypothetical protein As57867_000240 [Aphanomyces stellatus]VFT77466.1 Aste57867_240 [Aphanomyces stellatus]